MASYFKCQRTPNIFERARAYDNLNEGNFPPQEDGYEDTYNKLDTEKLQKLNYEKTKKVLKKSFI